MKNSDIDLNRVKELSDTAWNSSRWTFTEFLGLPEQSDIQGIKKELKNLDFFGGCDGCERVVARFGSEEDCGWEQPYPIVCLLASPDAPKFADKLTHRDFLGAIMNLGIERKNIGDIVVKDNTAYIFCLEKISNYICDNLLRVKHTDIHCEETTAPSFTELFKTEEMTVNTASYRADCLISAVYNISRTKAEAYFDAEAVFINGRVCRKSDTPQEGDKVSVRHLGKFSVGEQSGTSKKGRNFIVIHKYI